MLYNEAKIHPKIRTAFEKIDAAILPYMICSKNINTHHDLT